MHTDEYPVPRDLNGDRRNDDNNSQQFSWPAAESKLREPRVNVPRAESVNPLSPNSDLNLISPHNITH